jgi:cytochrome c oxidase subunit II
MVDSLIVLWGQTLAYSFYCISMILLMGWFRWRVTAEGDSTPIKPAIFYSFVAFLTILGVSLHIVTAKTIPWVDTELHRASLTPDKTFKITVANHEFKLPAEKLEVKTGELVLFDVQSSDLTYGFGVFRPDNTMVFQMQVLPGHRNDILWEFAKPGTYTIRSTEYSGPKGINMVLKDVIQVAESR